MGGLLGGWPGRRKCGLAWDEKIKTCLRELFWWSKNNSLELFSIFLNHENNQYFALVIRQNTEHGGRLNLLVGTLSGVTRGHGVFLQLFNGKWDSVLPFPFF